MANALQLHKLGIFLILLAFIYIIYLVRSKKLNSQLAISWAMAEASFITVFLSDTLRSRLLLILGGGNLLIGAAILALAWLAFLVLESHTRISLLTTKQKEISQELALLRERFERSEVKNCVGNYIASPHSQRIDQHQYCLGAQANEPAAINESKKHAKKSIFQHVLALIWITTVLYTFAVYSDLVPLEGDIRSVLTPFFTSLTADYLH